MPQIPSIPFAVAQLKVVTKTITMTEPGSGTQSPASAASSPGDSSNYSDDSNRPYPYTAAEFGEIFLDFYTFLATLHYRLEDLKIPPSDGWPQITPEYHQGLKSDFAIEVMRHLPYFKYRAAIHYKSGLIDYTVLRQKEFRQMAEMDSDEEFYSDSGEVDSADVFRIAWGHESGGREFFLNVKQGEITDEQIRCNTVGTYDVQEFFDDLKESYRNLRLIPSIGRITIEADRIEEREEKISLEEVKAQTEEWGSDLDVQYLRQLYREHGWPDAFQKVEAEKAVDDLLDSLGERGDWEPSGWAEM